MCLSYFDLSYAHSLSSFSFSFVSLSKSINRILRELDQMFHLSVKHLWFSFISHISIEGYLEMLLIPVHFCAFCVLYTLHTQKENLCWTMCKTETWCVLACARERVNLWLLMACLSVLQTASDELSTKHQSS